MPLSLRETPERTIEGRSYYETEDRGVFIESLVETADPDAPEIVFVSFVTKRRWKQWGSCYSCGIADYRNIEDGNPVVSLPIRQVSGKKIGERYSVVDTTYDRRKHVVCTPEYDRDARQNAAELGLPYACGLRFQELPWLASGR